MWGTPGTTQWSSKTSSAQDLAELREVPSALFPVARDYHTCPQAEGRDTPNPQEAVDMEEEASGLALGQERARLTPTPFSQMIATWDSETDFYVNGY